MKPFDLEKALAGKPVVTRDGNKVTQLTLFKTRRKQFLFGVVEFDDYSNNYDNIIVTWDINGRYYNPYDYIKSNNDNFDLFMYEKTNTKKIKIAIGKYPMNDYYTVLHAYNDSFEYKKNWIVKEVEIEVE